MFGKNSWQSWLRTLALTLGAIVLFFTGIYFGENARVTRLNAATERVNLTEFWKVWDILDERYVDTRVGTSTKKITDQLKIEGAIAGLVDSFGDPYTVFMPPQEKKAFEEDIRGNFGGVGMEIGYREKKLIIIAPLPNTPAMRGGVEAGDLIIEINGESASDLSVYGAVQKIRGEVDTKVKIKVLKKDQTEPVEITLTREVIKIPTLKTQVINNDGKRVFLIKLYNFNAEASADFRMALREFVASGGTRLILDLRGNPGGYLESSVDIASWFLPAGTTVVIEDRGVGAEPKIYRSKGYNVFNKNLKMAVLVDGGSASASEILAGALAENGRATLVGEKTFGKGSVQEVVEVGEGSALKVTIAKWLTPLGHSISGNGITPTVEVKFEEATSTEPRSDLKGTQGQSLVPIGESLDNQIIKALEVIK